MGRAHAHRGHGVTGDRPTASELVAEVARWLTDEHAPTLSGGPRFQTLVAAQALAIAGRELDLGAAHAEADAAALGAFVAGTPADDVAAVRRALAEAIRAGEHDDDLPALAAVLGAHVRRKLALARPGYADAPA